MPKAIDMTGQVFFNWMLLEKLPLRNGHTYYRCRCVCGTEKDIEQSGLKSGASKSCGCKFNIGNAKHRKCGTKVYIAWQNMVARCTNPKLPSYKNYGAKGITLCGRWRSFENFL